MVWICEHCEEPQEEFYRDVEVTQTITCYRDDDVREYLDPEGDWVDEEIQEYGDSYDEELEDTNSRGIESDVFCNNCHEEALWVEELPLPKKEESNVVEIDGVNYV